VTDSSKLVGCSCYSTLLEWIDGTVLTQKEDNIEDIAFKLGENLALFHQCLQQGKLDRNLVRPKYDNSRIDSAIEELKYCVKINLFSAENYNIIKEVLNVVKNQLKVLDTKVDAWGIIHADLQPGNIIINNGNPCLIDFGFCGYGYCLFDLGSAGTSLGSGLRKTFLHGYASKTTFSFSDIRYIEGLVFMDSFISYPLFMKDNNAWIKTHAEKTCNSFCKDFLEGREVFFSF
jgi:Ser/Thr protein kinase RdoA (MazF antagonist)